MAKILILFHSIYGHVERMAHAEADGAADVDGADVRLKRVPETLGNDEMRRIGGKVGSAIPVATPHELADYDALIFGTPTRFGGMSGQMRTFLDQTGGLWMSGALIGKIGSVFTSSATQHGGQESTILGFHTTLLHHGMIVVGLPYGEQRQMAVDVVNGGSPYGASTIAGSRGERLPSETELAMARSQGRHVATLALRLAGR